MASRGRAFCPGHVTGFFQIHRADDPYRTGSRGAGLCLGRGVETTVEVDAAPETRVEIRLNGDPAKAETTERVVRLLLEEPARVRVEAEVQLPVGQGFGMSGAGALATSLALNEALGEPRRRDEVVAAAHRAEVESFTGLGDVYPQSLGGMDLRERPGAPPHGRIQRTPVDADLVLCVLGAPTYTKDVLRNPMVAQSINSVGGRCVDRFRPRQDLENLFRLSWLFARQTLLATTEVQAAVLKAELFGRASQALLGNAVFAEGSTEKLGDALREHGAVHRARVDNRGARVL